MNPYRALFKMFYWDIRFSFLIFWSILIGVFVITSFLVMVVFNSETFIFSGGNVSVIIYFYILGFMTLKSTLSFALGLSITRKDYYLAAVSSLIITALCSSLLYSFFQWFERAFVTSGSMARPDSITFRYFYIIGPDTFLISFWSNFIIPLFAASIAFMISSFVYKYGRKAVYAMFVISLSLILMISSPEIRASVEGVLPESFVGYTLVLSPLTIFFFLLGWIGVRRVSVKSAA